LNKPFRRNKTKNYHICKEQNNIYPIFLNQIFEDIKP